METDDAPLKTIAADLTKGFGGRCWSITRSNDLQRLYPEYDCQRDTEYKIVEVTDLIIMPKEETLDAIQRPWV